MKIWLLLSLSVISVASNAAERVDLQSKITQEQVSLQIKLPDTYHHSSDFKYPLLLVLDGSVQFEHIAANVQFLSVYSIVPEMIVVGVGVNNRLKFFTSTNPDPEKIEAGRAKDYQEFLEHEVIATLKKRYRIAPYTMISGHSMSGLFTSYIALQPDTAFNAAISISPSLWWDNNSLVTQYDTLVQKPRKKPMRWFLSMANEPNEMADAFASMRTKLQQQTPTQLIWHTESFPNETHDSTPLTGNIQALKMLFKDWNPVPNIEIKSLTQLRDFYREKATVYSYQFPLSAHQYNVFGLKAAYENKKVWGIEILEEGTKSFPKSEILWDSLATAYTLNDEWLKAKSASTKAVSLGKKHQSIFINEILAQAERINTHIAESKP